MFRKKFFLYITVLLTSGVFLSGCTRGVEYDESKINVIGSDEQAKDKGAEDSSEDNDKSVDLGYLSDTTGYAKEVQSVGENTESMSVLESIEDTQNSGYHEFKFKIVSSGEDKRLAIVTAEPVLEKGVVRVTLNNIESDNSGISFQSSRNINKGAIISLSHMVTSKENISIYEVGVAGNNLFKLSSETLEDGTFLISLKVSYDLKYSAPDMDLGSIEFSSEKQEIKGMTVSDGARIASYSYSVSGDTLRFVFITASGTSNPVPAVTAEYDDMNILNVKFGSLTSDKVSTWGNKITLPAGVVVDVSRSGESSLYKFNGIGGKNSFRLSASKSPNQVIVEIKLK